MKMRFNRLFAMLLALCLFLGIGFAGENNEFDAIINKAKGSTVHFYGWGGDELLNDWLDSYLAPRVKEKYDIKLERVPMGIEDILGQLTGEIQVGAKGDIDMIWINGENFKSAKENNMLHGPFVEKLPNYNSFVDGTSSDITMDFAYPVDGFEAPYGKAQFVLIADTAKTKTLPKNAQEFKKFVMENKGKVSYPALPDFTGSAFVRNIIYEIVGVEKFNGISKDKEAVRAAVMPAMEYLRSLNPYLWNEGKTFPATSGELDNMFADGELNLMMTYGAFSAAVKIENGKYPKTAQTFQFDKGTIGNTNFIAISKNSKNIEGAMVVINEILSPEVQANRYAKLKTIPVLDNSKLSTEQKEAFNVDIGMGVVPQEELLKKFLSEMSADLVPIIEEIWAEEVVGK